LSDFIGKNVVLYFYPKDNTPGCTTEACEFSAIYDDFIDNTTCLNLSQSVIEQSSDWLLREKYPKAYDLMSKEKGSLYFLTNETDVKLLSDIFSLLIPKDRDLFDNLTVYGEVTRDGKDHVVHSYEEFINVLKPKEELSNVR